LSDEPSSRPGVLISADEFGRFPRLAADQLLSFHDWRDGIIIGGDKW
jgi:hypothetical protein